ncbi:MAG: glycosyltransferase family 4 protein [Bacteroidota bacterium]|nr:glycosyltransferase family 4 protein [Bacteroidota bacterium]
MPYPPDYGGVFDLFYKIKSFHETGISIHLHCFEYGRGAQDELNQYCETINYYKRKSFLKSFSLRLPYIVSSRENDDLLKNLLKDDYPILLEGIHCTYFLNKNSLKKKTFVRLHNVEYEYYNELAKTTNNIFKKIHFFTESLLLKKYERSIANKATFIAVNKKDENTYRKNLGAKHLEYLPVFLPFDEVMSEEGNGSFCLYHGNLSVPENEKAVLWLLSHVFNNIEIPFVIAGKNPSKKLAKCAQKNKNTCLVANPANHEMNELIKKAHVHILPSFNKTGIKIKLLNALFNGKFIIANLAAVEGTNLAGLCEMANSPQEYKSLLQDLSARNFTEKNIFERKQILEKAYNKKDNIEKLSQWIW